MRPWQRLAWVAGLLLSLGSSWAIWRYAPLPDDPTRFAACLAPVALWGLVAILFSPRAGTAASTEGRAGLGQQRRAVLALLKERKLGGRRGRYSLPLYLVLGPPGFGKSSLLERSGLRLGKPVAIGETQWWIGEQAIFVEASVGVPLADTAGLFALLKSLRPRLPVNGTVLVLSPGDLAIADQVERRDMAEMIVRAVRELEQATGQRAPVYLALAKIDLMPGFLEFFDRLEMHEREQPWGFSLPLPVEAGAAAPSRAELSEKVSEGLKKLIDAMRARLVEWLSRESDPVRCGRIQSFGAQVAAIQPAIQPMLDALTPEDSRLWKGALLRSVFLTSARQEALSIDALLPELSGRFAMPRSGMLPPDLNLDEEAHGYFIGGAFRDAIFPEAGLVVRGKTRRLGAGLQWTAALALIAVSLAAGYMVLTTYQDQLRWPVRTEAVAGGVGESLKATSPAAAGEVAAGLGRLDALDDELAAAPAVPPYLIGLAAAPPLALAVDAVHADGLRKALAGHLVALLETQLVDAAADAARLRSVMAVANDAKAPGAASVVPWLEATAATFPEPTRAAFVAEGAKAYAAAGTLTVDPAYEAAAQRLVEIKGGQP